ncbi:hypothetical protein ENBRE01_2646, partial [Enteropsectra breve]
MARYTFIRTEKEKKEVCEYLHSDVYPPNLIKDQRRAFRQKCQKFCIIGDSIAVKQPNGRYQQVVLAFENEKIEMILHQKHDVG